MDFLKNSLGGALDWAHNFRRDNGARRNQTAMRHYLIEQLRQECQKSSVNFEVLKQPALRPALKVAVALGVKQHSALMEYGGDKWSDVVFGILKQFEQCDEATVFLQLSVREARAYFCCTIASDGTARQRSLTILQVVDDVNLVDVYRAACTLRK